MQKRTMHTQTIKQIRQAIAPYLKFPNCKASQRIYSDRCKHKQSYKLPQLTDPVAALQAIHALNIANISNLRLHKSKTVMFANPYTTIRFMLPKSY